MSAALARYLKDFSEPEAVALPQMMDGFGAAGFEDDLELPPVIEVQVDIEAERAEAFEQGRQAATDELQQRFDEEREALVAAHAAQVKLLQDKIDKESFALLGRQINHIAHVLGHSVSDQTAKILTPLVDEAIVAKAIADMAEIIRTAMLDGELGTLTVRGPQHMFEKLKAEFGEPAPLLRHVEAHDLDISVDLGESALVTRMSAWSASLKKVLG